MENWAGSGTNLWLLFMGVLTLVASIVANIEVASRPFRTLGKKLKALLDMPMALEALSLHVEVELKSVNERLERMQIKSLARIIADVCMPIDARHDAAVEYLRLGGNGAIKQIYEDDIIPAYSEWLKERSGVK